MNTFKPVLSEALPVVFGGALGSLLRYYVGLFAHYQTRSPFPYKTLLVNVIGCFLVGFVTLRFQHHTHQPMIRLFFIIGFLGAFTTFSTFSYETVQLLQNGHFRTAVLNVFASTFAGLLAVLAGMWAGNAI